MGRTVKFIHTSDWQLGMTRVFLSEEAASRFSQARIDAITALGKHAIANEARFIVVAGDVFESNQLSRRTVARALDALGALAVPVFLLPGNHDPLDGSSILATEPFRKAGGNIVVLDGFEPVPVPGLPGVEVVGAPWRTRRPGSDLCREMANALEPAAGIVRVAVAHGQVDALSPDLLRPDIIELASVEQAIRDRKFHYLALGDRHSVTEVGTSGRVWYSGAPVATAFDEQDPNKILLVELDAGETCRIEPLLVGNWTFVAAQRDVNGPDDVDRFGSWLNDLPDKASTVVKVGFQGSIALATAARLDELMQRNADLFASLRQRNRTTDLAVVPDELDQDSVSLSGYARAAWNELLERAAGNDEIAGNALRLFYRLSRRDGT